MKPCKINHESMLVDKKKRIFSFFFRCTKRTIHSPFKKERVIRCAYIVSNEYVQ